MPAWFYGPGGEARLFADGEAMPEGWADSPAAFVVAPVIVTGHLMPPASEVGSLPTRVMFDQGETPTPKRGPGRPRKVA